MDMPKTKKFYRKKWEAEGKCIQCGRIKTDPKYKVCSICREKQREYYSKNKNNNGFKERISQIGKDTYVFYKENGICTRCHSKDAIPGQILCADCREKNNARRRGKKVDETAEQKSKRAECKRRLYHFRKENGLCVRCGEKALPGLSLCALCRLYVNQLLSGHVNHTDKWREKERKAGRL